MGFCSHIDGTVCGTCWPLRSASTKPPADLVLKSTKPGAWVAYNADDSGITLFATEIDALRYAVNLGMAVKFVEFGSTI